MTDSEKLEIAVNLLDKRGLEEYEMQVYSPEICDQCRKLGETTCGNDIDCQCFEPK